MPCGRHTRNCITHPEWSKWVKKKKKKSHAILFNDTSSSIKDNFYIFMKNTANLHPTLWKAPPPEPEPVHPKWPLRSWRVPRWVKDVLSDQLNRFFVVVWSRLEKLNFTIGFGASFFVCGSLPLATWGTKKKGGKLFHHFLFLLDTKPDILWWNQTLTTLNEVGGLYFLSPKI